MHCLFIFGNEKHYSKKFTFYKSKCKYILINALPFLKAMVMEPTATLFAYFPCILLADTAFALSAQMALVVIHSIGSHIYANTAACWKYSAAGFVTLR